MEYKLQFAPGGFGLLFGALAILYAFWAGNGFEWLGGLLKDWLRERIVEWYGPTTPERITEHLQIQQTRAELIAEAADAMLEEHNGMDGLFEEMTLEELTQLAQSFKKAQTSMAKLTAAYDKRLSRTAKNLGWPPAQQQQSQQKGNNQQGGKNQGQGGNRQDQPQSPASAPAA